jgi:orotate phosphoribosyltransferase
MAISMDYIWKCGIFYRGERELASGAIANNFFDFEKLEHDVGRRQNIVSHLSEKVVREAACLVSIGNGAHFWTRDLGELLGLEVAFTDKLVNPSGKKSFEWSDTDSKHIAKAAQKADQPVVIVDDASTRYSSLDMVMQLPEITPENVLFVNILHRGPLEILREYHMPLVAKHIEEQLPDNSLLWQHAIEPEKS